MTTKKPWYKNKWFWIILAGATLLGGIFNALGISPSKDKETETTKPVVTVTPTPEPEPEPEPTKPAEPTETSKGLTGTYAQAACVTTGKKLYPYGFKAHTIVGVISDRVLNDQWFYKAEVTIENEYGNKLKTVFECTVDGTNDWPEIVSFYVY